MSGEATGESSPSEASPSSSESSPFFFFLDFFFSPSFFFFSFVLLLLLPLLLLLLLIEVELGHAIRTVGRRRRTVAELVRALDFVLVILVLLLVILVLLLVILVLLLVSVVLLLVSVVLLLVLDLRLGSRSASSSPPGTSSSGSDISPLSSLPDSDSASLSSSLSARASALRSAARCLAYSRWSPFFTCSKCRSSELRSRGGGGCQRPRGATGKRVPRGGADVGRHGRATRKDRRDDDRTGSDALVLAHGEPSAWTHLDMLSSLLSLSLSDIHCIHGKPDTARRDASLRSRRRASATSPGGVGHRAARGGSRRPVNARNWRSCLRGSCVRRGGRSAAPRPRAGG